MEAYKEVIGKLPREHKLVLFRLVKFLQTITQNSDKNKMTAGNLAIVFAPNILKAKDEKMPSPSAAEVVEDIIQHFDEIFASELSISEEPQQQTNKRNRSIAQNNMILHNPNTMAGPTSPPPILPKQSPLHLKHIGDIERGRSSTDPIMRAGQWPLPHQKSGGSNTASPRNPSGPISIGSYLPENSPKLFSDIQSNVATRSPSRIRQLIPLQEENKRLEVEKKRLEDQLQQLKNQSEMLKKPAGSRLVDSSSRKLNTSGGSSGMTTRLTELSEALLKIQTKLDANNAQIDQLRQLRNETMTKI
eukprot:TRINITY_DN4687_c0_g1_i1.p1 TRINITY_DN4687_c0_g1~~TRINITY_DN4687_c0_g1_i1.p1  ORF type:complete len:339 (-),score=89.39 TRINITY_DN4687_c0_g1_i1:93-1001(-)